MASAAACQQIAEKYVPEIIAGVGHPIEYRDARVESTQIVVKTTEMDPQLRGWLGYAVPVSKKGRLGKATPVVIGEPGIAEFLAWAKEQSIKTLTAFLAANGIVAKGDVVFMLAYRLTYCYEQAWRERRGTWPLEPAKMEARKRKITALNKFINVKGVGNHPDEFAIVQKMFLEEGKPQPTHRETGDTHVPDEKRSDVLKRLRQQAAQEEEKSEKTEQSDKGKSGEVDAVKAGKKAKEKPPTAVKTDTKPTTQEPPVDTPASEESDVSKKKSAKKSDKKAEKKAAKKEKVAKPAKAAKAEKKGNANAKAKDFPIGCKVKYVGTRVKHHVGKTGEVTAHKTEKGLAIKWSDGLVATATAGAVERVK